MKMNPKQRLFHQRLVQYLKKNGLDDKDAQSAATNSVRTLIKQGDGFQITNVPKMGKWLLKEREAYDKKNDLEHAKETIFDTSLGKLFRSK